MTDNFFDDELAACVSLLNDGDWRAAYSRIAYHRSGSQHGFLAYQIMLRALMARQQLVGQSEKRTKERSKIPKIIFQFWDAKALPRDVDNLMGTWKSHNPEYQHVLFDDQTAEVFILEEFGPLYAECYSLCFHPAMKSDFFRLCFGFAKGGIYVDADEECLIPLRNWLGDLPEGFIASWDPNPENAYIHNWFFVAPTGFEAFSLALARAVDRILAWKAGANRPYLWDTTGPGCLTRGVVDYCHKKAVVYGSNSDDVTLLDQDSLRIFLRARHLPYMDTRANWRRA